MKTKMILIDDQVLVMNGLGALIKQTANVKIVAQFARLDKALSYVRDHPVELVVMEWNLSGIGGIEATRRLRKSCPKIKILIVSHTIDDPFPRRLIEAGANGLISKKSSHDELKKALRNLMDGQLYVSAEIAQKTLAREYLMLGQQSPFETLTNRELQIMMLAVEGKRTRDISQCLSLSPKTVSTYRHRLYSKLGVKSGVELTRLAIRYGVAGEQLAFQGVSEHIKIPQPLM